MTCGLTSSGAASNIILFSELTLDYLDLIDGQVKKTDNGNSLRNEIRPSSQCAKEIDGMTRYLVCTVRSKTVLY